MTDYTAGKQLIIDTCIRLSDRGFLAGTGGNIALRLDDRHFAVTPSATDYYTMQVENIAVLRLDDLAQIEGDKPSSVERGLHACLLRAKPDFPATIHTHQPVASGAALLHEAIPVTEAGDRALLGPAIEVVSYWPSGSGLLVNALARRVRPEIHAYLMASHGVICAGATMPSAVEALCRLEAAAARFLADLIEREDFLPAPIRQLALTALTMASPKE